MWTCTTTADRQTGQPMPSYSIPTPRDPQANFARVPDFNRDVGWPAYFLRLVDAPVGSPGDAARRSTISRRSTTKESFSRNWFLQASTVYRTV